MAVERRHFTVAEYERMIAAGILIEDERVELIAGEIVEMGPISPRHAHCVNLLARAMSRVLPEDMLVSVQNPIRLFDDNEPQPDIAALHDRDYAAIPTAGDIALVIEVADSSRDYDRGTKIPLYGAAGIPEAWLIDLVAERIKRYTEPALTIAVDAILGYTSGVIPGSSSGRG